MTRNTATTRKRSAPPRNTTNSNLKSSTSGLLECFYVGWPFFTAMRPLAGPVGASIFLLGCSSATLGWALNYPPCAPTNGRPGFPFGFLGAGGRLPKARRGRVFIVKFIIIGFRRVVAVFRELGVGRGPGTAPPLADRRFRALKTRLMRQGGVPRVHVGAKLVPRPMVCDETTGGGGGGGRRSL